MKSFSVEELAQLCSVNKETVRRWRKLGVGGNFLKSDHEERTQGKPARFSAEDVVQFAAAVPRVMTPELKVALGDVLKSEKDTAGAVRVKVRRSGMGSRSAVFAAVMPGINKKEKAFNSYVGEKDSNLDGLNIAAEIRRAESAALPIKAELRPEMQLQLGAKRGALGPSFGRRAKKPGRIK